MGTDLLSRLVAYHRTFLRLSRSILIPRFHHRVCDSIGSILRGSIKVLLARDHYPKGRGSNAFTSQSSPRQRLTGKLIRRTASKLKPTSGDLPRHPHSFHLRLQPVTLLLALNGCLAPAARTLCPVLSHPMAIIKRLPGSQGILVRKGTTLRLVSGRGDQEKPNMRLLCCEVLYEGDSTSFAFDDRASGLDG